MNRSKTKVNKSTDLKKTNNVTSKSTSKNVRNVKQVENKSKLNNLVSKSTEIAVEPKRAEKNNGSSITRKLSKFYNKISGSITNLDKIDDEKPDAKPKVIKRSLTLNSIQIKKYNRKSAVEPNLEKLHEEEVSEHPFVPMNNIKPFQPVKYERSNSIMSSIKRRMSFTDSSRKDSITSKWNNSLQSLILEDYMISYNDLSFVDYDQFNQYEANLEKKIYATSISRLKTSISDTDGTLRNDPTVVKKRLKSISSYENKLDKGKNLYRNSIDSVKLKHLCDVNRDSFCWSVERDAEALLLLDGYIKNGYDIDFPQIEKYVNKTTAKSASSFGGLSLIKVAENVAEKLKSRSLTHLDMLEPQITINPVTPKNDINDSKFKNVTSKVTNKIPPSESNLSCDDNVSSLSPIMAGTTSIGLHRSESATNKMYCMSSQTFTKGATNTLSSSMSFKKKSSSFLHRDRKKPILTRSQVSSSEYFSVLFDTDSKGNCKESKDRDEVFIPATKGVTLLDSLRHHLLQRSLSFSQICVIDNGFSNVQELVGVPQYLGPLDAYTDIGTLAGRSLIASDYNDTKRSGHQILQKAASVGYRSNKLFSSGSAEDAYYDQSPKSSTNKISKQKWALPFGSKGPQKTKLCELLDSYNKSIPKPTSSMSNFDNPDYLEALNGLENLPQSWTSIVNFNGMNESETKIQSAIWELVTTEVYYIHALQTVTDLFLACLENIQSQNILTDVDQNKLFSNIRDICECNLKFWTTYLYPMVKHSMTTSESMSIFYFQEGFVEFATIFLPYTKYCAEQSTCQFYCKELYHNNSLFMSYCAWCESQKMCNRLRLADILVRPMQRLTKYGLLLSAIRKHIVDENQGEVMDEMIHSVEVFVAGVNSHLTTRQENERLKGINCRIDAYDVVESNNEILDKMTKQYNTFFDLCQPMKGTDQGRHLFMEGDLKYKDNISKLDVHCFLLTDFLLVCKKTKHENVKVIRQPYMTDRLVTQIKESTLFCCYLNELNMIVAAFTLQGSKAQNWYDAITKARHIYSRIKQGSSWDMQKYGNTINISSNSNSNNNSNMNIAVDNLSIKQKSPINSSICSRVSSLNNSHSGSVELTDSKQVSVDFEKANSMSSDEGAPSGVIQPSKVLSSAGTRKTKSNVTTLYTSSNSLTVQPYGSLGQSMPNLNLNTAQTSNTLSVPGVSSSYSHSGTLLLSPSQRGISYPPPSPTRATLRRGFAFSSTIKNPPLVKTRNVPSQQSFSLTQQQSFNSASLSLQPSQSIASSFVEQGLAFVRRKNSFHSNQNQESSDT